MKKSYSLLLIAVLFIVPALLIAQPIRKAQKAMKKYEYSQAVVLLKKAMEKQKYKETAIPLLAECYRKQHDVFNTRTWYSRAVASSEARPESFLYYGQALQATGEYIEAREMFERYGELSADGRGSRFATHCDSVLGPWKGIKAEYEVKTVNTINSGQSEFGPSFYNGSLVYASDNIRDPKTRRAYGWTGRGYLDMMKSQPAKMGEFWGAMKTPTELSSALNQEYHDGPATFSRDGNTIYFTRAYKDKAKKEQGYKTNLLKIFYSTKNGMEWSDPKPFFLNSREYSIGHPSLSPDGKTLYFATDMPGGEGGTDIWVCQREGSGWGPAVNLGKTINTPEDEMFPFIKEDGSLYFASAGHPGYGALDIFRSLKSEKGWSTPKNLQPPINGSFDDFALALAPGEKNGFFSSNRSGGRGNDDIYAFREAELPPIVVKELEKPSLISGIVRDEVTQKPLEGATVFVFNPGTGKVHVLITGVDGMYKMVVENPSEYKVKAMKSNYIADGVPLKVEIIRSGTEYKAPRDLMLSKLEINRVFKIENIYYDFNKFNIRSGAKPELDKLVAIMKENTITVELGSHTDSRGNSAYNDHLSQNRATSAVAYIVSQGIDKSRITAKGYGERELANTCADGVKCSEEVHQANRRTEVKITGYGQIAQTGDQYNLSQYKAGDMIAVSSLPADFYSRCTLQKVKDQKESQPVIPVIKPAEALIAEVEKPVKTDVKVATQIVNKPEPATTILNAQPVNKPELAKATSQVSQSQFTVQFATGSLSPDKVKNIPGIKVYRGNDGVTRYYVGSFGSRQEASALKRQMIQKGFSDSWIAALDDKRPLLD